MGSFRAAAVGLGQTVRTEQNMRLHLAAMVGIVILGLWLDFEVLEWLLVVVCVVSVIGMELMNTAVEYLCNVVRDRLKLDYAATKFPRDMAAAAVLIVAIGAAVVGLVIIVPKVVALF